MVGKEKKINKRELQDIVDAARNAFIELNPNEGGLTPDEFIGKCYLIACSKVLNIQVEFPTRIPYEPAEE